MKKRTYVVTFTLEGKQLPTDMGDLVMEGLSSILSPDIDITIDCVDSRIPIIPPPNLSKLREQCMEVMEAPPGWIIWGNYGDGLWRAAGRCQENWIKPAKTEQEAIKRAWAYIDSFGWDIPRECTFIGAGE